MSEEFSDFQSFDAPRLKEESNNFEERISDSLEDLVNTFDEKITKCFWDYGERVEKFAPVQVRTQDEIMNECQMWWTLTCNFGNMLPIDWSKSYTRKLHINCLNLNEKRPQDANYTPTSEDPEEEDNLAQDLDFHSLVLSSKLPASQEPLVTAEEVLKEIDLIMQEDVATEEVNQNEANPIESLLYKEKLTSLTTAQLFEVYSELERQIQLHSEVLVAELDRRDQLEYEKESKNSFVSWVLKVQDRRRRRRGNKEGKFLTTVIPYSLENGPPDNQTLQRLIKILKAINEDDPSVPALLTDYILKVLCPT